MFFTLARMYAAAYNSFGETSCEILMPQARTMPQIFQFAGRKIAGVLYVGWELSTDLGGN